jgi:hypothetical protein
MLALIPHANLSGTSNNYSVSGIDSLDRFSFDEKISWQIDPKSSLFGKLSYMDAEVKAPSSLGTGGGSCLISGGGSGYSQSHVIIGGLGYSRLPRSRQSSLTTGAQCSLPAEPSLGPAQKAAPAGLEILPD